MIAPNIEVDLTRCRADHSFVFALRCRARLFANCLAHHIGHGKPQRILLQGLVHHRPVVAATSSRARLECRQHGIICFMVKRDLPLISTCSFVSWSTTLARLGSAYRALFRRQLDAEATSDVRQALRLGIPLGSERFVDVICARLGIRRNTGKRGRIAGDATDSRPVHTEQQGFGF